MSGRESVIVVGAGLAGLYTARLLRRKHNVDPLIIEAGASAGGKIKTVYDVAGRVQYEAGPWRVPSAHRRVVNLFQELGVPLRPGRTEYRASDRTGKSIRGLSEWGSDALRRKNPLSADHADLATGYADIHRAASGSLSEILDTNVQLVSDDGFSTLATRLSSESRILTNTRVVDIRRNGSDYTVQCRCREENDRFVNRTYTSVSIFVCVPPHNAERWTIFSQWARAQLYSVQSSPLHHIYAQTPAPSEFHVYSPTSLLGQGISSQYENSWFQASYTGGRLARFWYNLRLADPVLFAKTLIEEVKRVLHLVVETDTIASHFKEHAYHMWRPSPYFDLTKAVQSCVMPNPKHLPNVYWCGEAFSSYQGWMEGALETAELAVRIFTRQSTHIFTRRPPAPGEMVIEGRILDVTDWAQVHPGSTKAIKGHLGENVTDLFYHVRHSENAWSIVHALQVAVER